MAVTMPWVTERVFQDKVANRAIEAANQKKKRKREIKKRRRKNRIARISRKTG